MRTLLNLLFLALVLFAPGQALAGAPPACVPGCFSCAGPLPDQCLACASGAYLPTSPGTCTPCAPITACTSAVTCTSAGNSQCTSCINGAFLLQGPSDQCVPCTDVPGCTGQLTCTTAASSVCSACVAGFYLSASQTSCQPCSPVLGCTSSLTCTAPSNSQCTSCAAGRYLESGVADTCPSCPGITDCASPVTCTDPSNSQCNVCASGHYLDETGPTDSCPACTPVAHCASALTCTTGADSVCTACDSGYVLDGGTCQEACTPSDCSDHGTPAVNGTRPSNCGCVCDAGWTGPDCNTPVADPCTRADCSNHGDATGDRPTCTCSCDAGFLGASCGAACSPIAFCASAVTCTTAGDSQCTSCAAGHHLVEGAVDSCPADAAITDIPVAGDRTRLTDLPKKRQSQISSYDKAIDLMTVDPTVSGATLAIFSPTTGNTFTLALPASSWQGPLPGRRFRYTAAGNPRVKILLVNGRLLKITLRGSGAYPLGTAQEGVGVTLTIGTTRFCTLFGGTITKDNGVRFVARKAPRPATCPVDPAANEAPVAQPNGYDTDNGVVSAALLNGAYSVGNILTDGGPLVDSDPEGGALSVHAVSNPTLTIRGVPVPLTLVSGGVATYSFDNAGRTAAFSIASDGAVGLTGDPSVFVSVEILETASFQFDYTVTDPLGSASNPAHVSVIVHGTTEGCVVGGRC